MVIDVIQPDRCRLIDQHPQHAKTLGQRPDLLSGGFVDTFVDELDELVVGSHRAPMRA
jgi:hypothetical protein